MNEKDKAPAKFDRLAEARKMVNLTVLETSGVDVPAHGQMGWIVAKAATNPRSPEAVKARKQEHAARIKERLQQALARRAGGQEMADPTKEFEDAVKALMLAKKLTRAQAIAQLADKKPDMVAKAESARQAKLDSDRKAAVAKASEPETAQEKIMAKANEFFVEGRAKSIPDGVVLVTKLYPELAEEALSE